MCVYLLSTIAYYLLSGQDFVDGVKLQLLAQTYFSKTKNQTISARFDFSNGAAFESDLIALEATVENMVNNINLNEFVSKAILDEEDQVFEDIVDMEECEIRGKRTIKQVSI